jgi:hypothetical protein
MQNPLKKDNLDKALTLLAGRLDIAETEPVRLVVCGGSALIAMGLRQRTTRDVDVVALMNAAHDLIQPGSAPGFPAHCRRTGGARFGVVRGLAQQRSKSR